MPLPSEVQEILDEIGQVAVELPCRIEGYREFVTIYAGLSNEVLNCYNRFPYLEGIVTIFRAVRFRVKSDLIENDVEIGPDDLIDHHQIYLPNEDAVEFVMKIWKVPVKDLTSPRNVEIPV